MKAADTNIIKGIIGFLDYIQPDVKDCLINFGIGIDNVLKGNNTEKISFNFNFSVPPDNFPSILNEEGHLKKIKSELSKRIGKDIRYLKVYWSYIDDKSKDKENVSPCSISFDVKF